MEILKTVTAVSLTEKPIAQSLTTKLFLALKVISFSHPQSYFFLSLGGHLVVAHIIMRERQREITVSRCFVTRSRW
jgi:hypothetical protein